MAANNPSPNPESAKGRYEGRLWKVGMLKERTGKALVKIWSGVERYADGMAAGGHFACTDR